MTCRSCEERAEMLIQARDALNRGDRAEAARCLMEVFGSAIGDISKLQSIVFRTKELAGEQIKPPKDGETS